MDTKQLLESLNKELSTALYYAGNNKDGIITIYNQYFKNICKFIDNKKDNMTKREELNQLNKDIKKVNKSLKKQAKYWEKIDKHKNNIGKSVYPTLSLFRKEKEDVSNVIIKAYNSGTGNWEYKLKDIYKPICPPIRFDNIYGTHEVSK